MPEQWYAQYRDSDKVVVSAGYVDPESLDIADHSVSVGFSGEMPELTSGGGAAQLPNYTKQYNTTTDEIEDIP